jgi:hypothetical protein
MGIIKHSDGAHWYQKDGSPQYDADLRVARKVLLYPSVTTIDKAWFANTFLERWKLDQLVQACVDNPRQPHESVEDYGQRVYEISNTKARVASEFGKKIHSVVENYPIVPGDALLVSYYDKYAQWHEKNIESVVESEGTVLDHSIGVAGRFDKLVVHRQYGLVMVDYKTQGVKKDKKDRKVPVFYESWIRQLGFYANAKAKQNGSARPRCLSVVIDSTEVSDPYENLWTEEEQQSGLEDFTYAAFGWFKRKHYWPIGQWNPKNVL